MTTIRRRSREGSRRRPQNGGAAQRHSGDEHHRTKLHQRSLGREIKRGAEARAQRRHRRASTAAMVVRSSSQKRDEGDQEKKLKPNRLGQSEEELRAELMAPTATAGTVGTSRGPAAAVRTTKVARAGHGRATE